MYKAKIGMPKTVKVSLEIEVVYDSGQFVCQCEAAGEAIEIVVNAARMERELYLHFEKVNYIDHVSPPIAESSVGSSTTKPLEK